jgi:hypothetical protein
MADEKVWGFLFRLVVTSAIRDGLTQVPLSNNILGTPFFVFVFSFLHVSSNNLVFQLPNGFVLAR